jgi:Xaa-Pro aminopeptidase
MTHSIETIQEQLKKLNVDGWLLYVWRDRNPTALATLGMPPEGHISRRAFYFIPTVGEPRKLQHSIEPHTLEHLPGSEIKYLSYQSLQSQLKVLIGDAKKIAMEYSPNALIPTVAWVDAGTIELVRSFGVEIESSAELIQQFEAVLSDDQIESHMRAAVAIRDIAREGFEYVHAMLVTGTMVREYDVQQLIMRRFEENHLITDHPPIVAANKHASDPHYCPEPGSDSEFEPGDIILIDLWAREDDNPLSIIADETWMGYMGTTVPDKMQEVWETARDARRAGFNLVQSRMEQGQAVHGWEVDDAVRAPIVAEGYGDYFIHRTGHSITTETHGSGANIDNLETKELRPLIPRTLFSLEPGIYLPEFGVRTENDVLITPDGRPIVADGCDQEDLITFQI